MEQSSINLLVEKFKKIEDDLKNLIDRVEILEESDEDLLNQAKASLEDLKAGRIRKVA